MNIVPYEQYDFSGGVQDATTWILRKPNELRRGWNLRFSEDLGGFERRPGFAQEGSSFNTNSNQLIPQGGHVAKFSTGATRFVVVNKSDNTATIIRKQNSSTGVWSDLAGIPTWPKDSVLFFLDYLDECYVSGFDPLTGDPIQPININKSLDVSTSRNLLGCPYGYFFAEYLGLLYIANVKVDTTRYPDRVYKSSPPLGAVTYIQGAQNGTLTTLKVDSVRYLKPGRAIDVYTAGTETKIYDLTITAVDKVNNIITFASASVTVGDNDEIWLDGTKGRLNIFWNTDYPNPEATGEFISVKPGADANNIVSGIRQSSNRLFIWTKNSGSVFDGNSLRVFNNSIGCISQRSIANIDDDWLIWVDGKGNVRARNESSGQQQLISRPMRKLLRTLTQPQLKAVHGTVVDQVYKLSLGTINGENIRICYDFEANTWSPERLAYPALIQVTDDYSGTVKPYFFSNNGKFYMDETGNMDDNKSIAFEAGTGPDMLGSFRSKRMYGVILFTENCSGMKFEMAADMGKMLTIFRIDGNICFVKFPERGDNVLPEGRAFDWQIMGAGDGDPQRVFGAIPLYSLGGVVPENGK